MALFEYYNYRNHFEVDFANANNEFHKIKNDIEYGKKKKKFTAAKDINFEATL